LSFRSPGLTLSWWVSGALSDDVLKEVQSVQETVGIPKDGELPAGGAEVVHVGYRILWVKQK
jgi:hypothetical protein